MPLKIGLIIRLTARNIARDHLRRHRISPSTKHKPRLPRTSAAARPSAPRGRDLVHGRIEDLKDRFQPHVLIDEWPELRHALMDLIHPLFKEVTHEAKLPHEWHLCLPFTLQGRQGRGDGCRFQSSPTTNALPGQCLGSPYAVHEPMIRSTIPIQLHLFRSSKKECLSRDRIRLGNHPWRNKPIGGIWTADFSFGGASAWHRFLRETLTEAAQREHWADGQHGCLLEPKDGISVFEIGCMSDYLELQESFPRKMNDDYRHLANPLEREFADRFIDFESAASAFDAIRLSDSGCRLSDSGCGLREPSLASLQALAGWGVPSTIWLKWSFREQARIMLPELLC